MVPSSTSSSPASSPIFDIVPSAWILTNFPQDQVVTLARAIGISPAIVSDPKANKPAAEVQDLISRLSLNATKAEDLAMASAASATNETQILTAASFKKLDDDIRTVHANVVIASEDARDSDGWMRWVRYEHDKEILQLKAKIEALIDIVMRNATESQKARVSCSLLSAKALVFRRADLCFTCSLPRPRRNASAS